MKSNRSRLDVNLEELDRVLDGARQAPLSEDDYEKLKEALHARRRRSGRWSKRRPSYSNRRVTS